jgi:hypothetical protein
MKRHLIAKQKQLFHDKTAELLDEVSAMKNADKKKAINFSYFVLMFSRWR